MSTAANARISATGPRARMLFTIVLLSASVAACAQPRSTPSPVRPATTGSPARSSIAASVSPAAPSSPAASRTLDRASRNDAVRAAHDALTEYARTDRPHDVWVAALRPRLTRAALTALHGSDPAAIPITTILSPGRLIASPDPDLALTQIPTDAGTYWVLVSRTGPTARWLIERITPPHFEGS